MLRHLATALIRHWPSLVEEIADQRNAAAQKMLREIFGEETLAHFLPSSGSASGDGGVSKFRTVVDFSAVPGETCTVAIASAGEGGCS